MYLCGLCFFFLLSAILFSFNSLFFHIACCLLVTSLCWYQGYSKSMLVAAYNTVQYLGYLGKWVWNIFSINFKTGYKVLCLKVHVSSVATVSRIFLILCWTSSWPIDVALKPIYFFLGGGGDSLRVHVKVRVIRCGKRICKHNLLSMFVAGFLTAWPFVDILPIVII